MAGEWDRRRRETPQLLGTQAGVCAPDCAGVHTDTLTPTQAHEEMGLAGKVPELALRVGTSPD